MPNVLEELQKKKLITLPSWLHTSNIVYLTIMGSHAYGVADTNVKDKIPDFDVYGVAIPPKGKVFPQAEGHVLGFGNWANPLNKIEKDDPWQAHHILDVNGNGGKGREWDFQIYGIVRYFELLRTNNPSLVESIFTPENCVLHITQIGRLIRDNRRKFLGKISWKKFRGYALSSLKLASNKINQDEMQHILKFETERNVPHATTMMEVNQEILLREAGNHNGSLSYLDDDELVDYRDLFKAGMKKNTRFEDNKKFQMDRKFLYNIIRLLDEAEQIMEGNGERDIDIQRSKEVMKAVRRGEWSTEQIQNFVAEKDIAMEATFSRCTLPEYPDEKFMRMILLQCLEMHYGSLESCVSNPDQATIALKQIQEILDRNRGCLL